MRAARGIFHGMPSPEDLTTIAALLTWQVEAGADEAIEAAPIDRYKSSAAPQTIAVPRAFAPVPKSAPVQLSEAPLAQAALKPAPLRAPATPAAPRLATSA